MTNGTPCPPHMQSIWIAQAFWFQAQFDAVELPVNVTWDPWN